MSLTDFTSYDDIRAALGVSAEEIEDATLSLPLYELNLVSELEEVNLDLISNYMDLQGIDASTLTAEQQRFDRYAQLFATYAVAKNLTVSLPLFSPKEVTDGKAGFSRYSTDPYKVTIARVIAECDKFRTKLEKAYGDLTSVATVDVPIRTFMFVASPTSDPITGT
jgi:hypothetical protein